MEAKSGDNLGFLSFLNSKVNSKSFMSRMLAMPDTILLQHGTISAWFFVSKVDGRLLKKNRDSVSLKKIVKAFVPRESTGGTKVAMIFRGMEEPIQYLNAAEFQNFLEYRSVTEKEKVALIQKIQDPFEEFDAIKFTMFSYNHCLYEGRRSTSRFGMGALDSFVFEGLPLHRINPGISFHDVEECEISRITRERLTRIVRGMALHVEAVAGCRLQKFTGVFKLGVHNNSFTFLVPLDVQFYSKILLSQGKLSEKVKSRKKKSVHNSCSCPHENTSYFAEVEDKMERKQSEKVLVDDDSPEKLKLPADVLKEYFEEEKRRKTDNQEQKHNAKAKGRKERNAAAIRKERNQRLMRAYIK